MLFIFGMILLSDFSIFALSKHQIFAAASEKDSINQIFSYFTQILDIQRQRKASSFLTNCLLLVLTEELWRPSGKSLKESLYERDSKLSGHSNSKPNSNLEYALKGHNCAATCVSIMKEHIKTISL